MRIVDNINDMNAIIHREKDNGKTIGFVPTMGYLHEGHLSLARASVSENDFTVLSIFVNPIQFGVNEDFSSYPRDLSKDCVFAESVGVDVVFAPKAEEMYPSGFKSYVEVTGITDVLCGKTRPGHFKGVTTVVNKLFNIIKPDNAYFGQKDAQQASVIKKMVNDLNMDVKISICPIVREEDGLAMSSRNVYLSPLERKSAVILSKSLFESAEMIKSGERRSEKIAEYIRSRITDEGAGQIEYIAIVNQDSLENVKILNGKILIALAVKYGTTRLIDNITLEV